MLSAKRPLKSLGSASIVRSPERTNIEPSLTRTALGFTASRLAPPQVERGLIPVSVRVELLGVLLVCPDLLTSER